MGLFGPSVAEMQQAISAALSARETPPPLVLPKFPTSLDVAQPEVRPARDMRPFADDDAGARLDPRPHALWANGAAEIKVENESGDVVLFKVAGPGPIDVSPAAIHSVKGGPIVLLFP